ncbi:hypothetical protein KGQ24_01075 [Patescibacteria group bacterium]|nr:hypothetical protein [Patescibacteria group bacterium]
MAIPYYIFAWIASALFGVEAIIGKLTSKYMISNVWLFNFIWNFALALMILPFAVHYGQVSFHFSWHLILASLLYAAAGVLYLICLFRMDISVLSPLYNFRTWFAVILGALFLHEVLTGWQYLLIAFMFVAGIFAVMDESWNIRSFFTKNIGLAMLQMLVLAFEALFINLSIKDIGFWGTTLWIAIIGQIILVATLPLFWKELFRVTPKQLGACILMAAAGTLGTIAVNKAYQTNISITSVIISVPLSMIAAYVLSIFAPKLLEKHTHKVYLVRFAAAALMIIGAIQLTR